MNDRIKYASLITIACVLFAVAMSAANTPEPYTLDNGLTVILRPVPTANKAAFVVLFNLGGAHDPIGKSGMAHLLEHVYVTAAAGGTPARNVRQFMERYPAGWNAQTGLDFTVIAGVVEPRQFTEELKDVAARMNDLRITEADIAREVPRVSQELGNMYGGIPSLAGLNHTRSQLHPIPQAGQYGGAPAHIQTINLRELQQFWQDYYKPNNAILVIAGKFDVTQAQKSIHENLSQVPSGKLPPTKPPTPKAETGAIYRVTVKPLVKDAKGVAAIGYAPPPLRSAEYAPFLVVVSRLWSSLQPTFERAKVQPIYYAPLVDPTTIALQADLSDEKDSETALSQLNEHLHTALTSKLTPQDKQQTTNTIPMLLGKVDIPSFMWSQNLYRFAFIVGRQYQMQMDSKALLDAVQRVTDADIQHLATSIFAPEKRVTVIIELEK